MSPMITLTSDRSITGPWQKTRLQKTMRWSSTAPVPQLPVWYLPCVLATDFKKTAKVYVSQDTRKMVFCTWIKCSKILLSCSWKGTSRSTVLSCFTKKCVCSLQSNNPWRSNLLPQASYRYRYRSWGYRREIVPSAERCPGRKVHDAVNQAHKSVALASVSQDNLQKKRGYRQPQSVQGMCWWANNSRFSWPPLTWVMSLSFPSVVVSVFRNIG